MASHTIGIIVHGATGRIGSTQHLKNALTPIRAEGGLAVGGDRIMPQLILVGRDKERLAAIARENGGAAWTTDLDAALSDPTYAVLFDAAATHQRKATLEKGIAAGKHIYAEKPVAMTVMEGRALLAQITARGLKHGAVEDKQYLPGMRKLSALAQAGFFGRILGFRLEFGWWVFDGFDEPCQRPSWNYRKAGGGGLLLDMYSHFRYLIEGLLGPIHRVVTSAAIAMAERVDEAGMRYAVDVEDQATTLIELASGTTGAIIASWATRVRRDDLMTFQIDGTKGSAIAGLHRCYMQPLADTPKTAAFNPTVDLAIDYRARWQEAPAAGPYLNPYRVGWEDFLRHLVAGAPLSSDFAAGVRDVAFAEACWRSAHERNWVSFDDAAS
ncbi:MAG TPA: Gfo/Idh/MocA family oxidoreductase [Xanthobacteraceae bacterium]|nr:Gfo/Idh/MocA family oxidoreductase [Xanthobacteraceae bacterium]